MEWNLQFVAIIVTVLLAIGAGFWRIIATMNKGFAEARREAREGRKEARDAVDKLRAEMNAGFAEEKEAREKSLAAIEKAMEKGFADAKEERKKGFAEAKEAREKGFAEAKEAREKGFAEEKEAREKGFAATEKAMEKGFADAKAERREIKDEMNRRFDAVETRIARLEAPYFQKKSQDQGRPVERVAEPGPSEEYAVASKRTGEALGAADSPDESDEDSAGFAGGISAGPESASSS